ncbi:MAG: hypothetical protein DIU64_002820 [Caldicoprobacter oshimai]|uniref:Uncharacterized protein n=1 Tax=Caldicoprobacter faecalis TaxID=937334 RepID=A0A1I5VBB0_9FIRM|nr:hypothetical protein [Caldicoprobacter faecalis]SFQ04216.1 hypothetical protein SAMN05444406_11052 [Caldicoprobacter faecalis]
MKSCSQAFTNDHILIIILANGNLEQQAVRMIYLEAKRDEGEK